MALAGLEQRFPALELCYQPYGPMGVPPWAHLVLDGDAAAYKHVVRRSRTHSGYVPWRLQRAAYRLSSEMGDMAKAGKDRGDELQRDWCNASCREETHPAQQLELSDTRCKVSCTIVVQNLPRRECLSTFQRQLDTKGYGGKYSSVFLPMHNGQNKGFAFVTFVDECTAQEFFQRFATKKRNYWRVAWAHKQVDGVPMTRDGPQTPATSVGGAFSTRLVLPR